MTKRLRTIFTFLLALCVGVLLFVASACGEEQPSNPNEPSGTEGVPPDSGTGEGEGDGDGEESVITVSGIVSDMADGHVTAINVATNEEKTETFQNGNYSIALLDGTYDLYFTDGKYEALLPDVTVDGASVTKNVNEVSAKPVVSLANGATATLVETGKYTITQGLNADDRTYAFVKNSATTLSNFEATVRMKPSNTNSAQSNMDAGFVLSDGTQNLSVWVRLTNSSDNVGAVNVYNNNWCTNGGGYQNRVRLSEIMGKDVAKEFVKEFYFKVIFANETLSMYVKSPTDTEWTFCYRYTGLISANDSIDLSTFQPKKVGFTLRKAGEQTGYSCDFSEFTFHENVVTPVTLETASGATVTDVNGGYKVTLGDQASYTYGYFANGQGASTYTPADCTQNTALDNFEVSMRIQSNVTDQGDRDVGFILTDGTTKLHVIQRIKSVDKIGGLQLRSATGWYATAAAGNGPRMNTSRADYATLMSDFTLKLRYSNNVLTAWIKAPTENTWTEYFTWSGTYNDGQKLDLSTFTPTKIGFTLRTEKANASNFTTFSEITYKTVTDSEFKAQVSGKKVSVLGDSISTFAGVSNGTNVNDTLGSNAVWYDGRAERPMQQSQTWWQQVISRYDMELLVNNSWSGSSVTNSRATTETPDKGEAYKNRCVNLHDNTTSNNPDGAVIKPDIIAVYLGTNDLIDTQENNKAITCRVAFDEAYFDGIEANGFTPTSLSFDEYYALMIYKMTQLYSDADIFCFTLPTNARASEQTRLKFNRAITAIATHYGCEIVDLYSTPLSSLYTNAHYYIDGTHPTEAGMDLIANAFEDALYKKYVYQSALSRYHTTTATGASITDMGNDSYRITLGSVSGNDKTHSYVLYAGGGDFETTVRIQSDSACSDREVGITLQKSAYGKDTTYLNVGMRLKADGTGSLQLRNEDNWIAITATGEGKQNGKSKSLNQVRPDDYMTLMLDFVLKVRYEKHVLTAWIKAPDDTEWTKYYEWSVEDGTAFDFSTFTPTEVGFYMRTNDATSPTGKYSDFSEITYKRLANTYEGELVDIGGATTKEYMLTELPSIGHGQDGEVYGGYIFNFSSPGICNVYSVENYEKVSYFELDKKDVLSVHANSVQFGSLKYEASDEFPLLYVNIYNNYAGEADKRWGTCCVYRLQRNGTTFTTQLVQVIEIGFVGTEKWTTDGRCPYGNFNVDTDNNRLIAYTMQYEDGAPTDTSTIGTHTNFFEFDLPALSDGVYDSAYGCNVVTLNTEDILEEYTTVFFNYVQGSCYYDGKLYVTEGFANETVRRPAIRVIDLAKNELVTTVYLDDAGLAYEPELIAVYDGAMYLCFANNAPVTFYRIDFI